jgi:hypothetical protein
VIVHSQLQREGISIAQAVVHLEFGGMHGHWTWANSR